MAVNPDHIARLIIKQLNNDISDAERAELEAWRQESEGNKQMVEQFLVDENLLAGLQATYRAEEKVWERLNETIHQPAKLRTMKLWPRWAAAAAIVLVIGYGVWVMSTRKQPAQETVASQDTRFKNDVAPGTYKARLTLADGTVVVLDSAGDGELAKQGETVVMNKDGHLVYNSERSAVSGELIYNSVATARGETYATVLSDGTKVWLNSASSIKFPVAFTGNERRVEVTGEAYFEVAHNAKMPFKVEVNGIEIEDVGTAFNVNSYSDEPVVRTTLVEGSVNVYTNPPVVGHPLGKGDQPRGVTIKPGEQVRAVNGELSVVKDVDVDEVSAWRNGMFSFESADVQSIMRALARWYDIDVEYGVSGINERIHFEASRNTSLKNALKVLELTSGVRFRIEGKKLTVMK